MLRLGCSSVSCQFGKGIPTTTGETFLRHAHRFYREGQSLVQEASRALRSSSSVLPPCFKSLKRQPQRALSSVANRDHSQYKVSMNHTPNAHFTTSTRFMSSKAPNDQGDNKELKGKTALSAWKDLVSQQSVLGALVSIFKLLIGLIIDLLKFIINLLRIMAGQRGKDIADKARNSAPGIEMKKGYEKSKALAERELPKIQDKLEKSVPAAKKSMADFNTRFNNEITGAQSGQEKFQRGMGIIADLIKTNKNFQIFMAFILLVAAFKIIRFVFW